VVVLPQVQHLANDVARGGLAQLVWPRGPVANTRSAMVGLACMPFVERFSRQTKLRQVRATQRVSTTSYNTSNRQRVRRAHTVFVIALYSGVALSPVRSAAFVTQVLRIHSYPLVGQLSRFALTLSVKRRGFGSVSAWYAIEKRAAQPVLVDHGQAIGGTVMAKTAVSWILVGIFAYLWWWAAYEWSYVNSPGNVWTAGFIMFTLISMVVLTRNVGAAGAGMFDGLIRTVREFLPSLPWMALAAIVYRLIRWAHLGIAADPFDHLTRSIVVVLVAGITTALWYGAITNAKHG